MTSADATRARLARFFVETASELAALDRIAAEATAYGPELDLPEPSPPVLAFFAVKLHDYFTATEALFERVARAFDGDLPVGHGSHEALVDQMAADLAPSRPPVIDLALRHWLHDLRRFRHFFRHADSVTLEPAHVRRHVSGLATQHPAHRDALSRFIAFVERTRDALIPT